MKRGQGVYFRGFLIIVVIISIVIISLNLVIYNYYLGLAQSVINARASNTGALSLVVEGEDIVYPDISITYPASTTYTFHVIELNYSVGDISLESCGYSLNGGVTNTTLICGNNATGISSAEGSNTWIVYANDTSGNKNSSSVIFTAPVHSTTTAPSGGGGGGGGTPIVASKDFDVMPKEIDILIVSGKQTEKEIRIVNTGKAKLVIDISASGITNFISVNTNQLTLASAEEKIILLTVKAPESGVYAGKIIFDSGNLQKEILVLINVRSEKKLFDVSATVPESRKDISVGEDLDLFISLIPIGEPVQASINVRYVIKDFNGNILYAWEETMLFYEAKSFIKKFITSKLSSGDYIVGIEIVYPEGFAAASAYFRVIEKAVNFKAITAITLFISAIIVIFYSILKYKKAKRHLNEVAVH